MKKYTIGEDDAGQRLDRFLKKLFQNASISLMYKLNRKGKIKVNRSKKESNYRLLVGDEVEIFLSDPEFDFLTKRKLQEKPKVKEKLNKKDIIYEDSYILAINKDPGVNVHPGDHKTKELDIISQVQDYLGSKSDSLTFKPSLIHRIDRDTSGILIIGKKRDILTKLMADFKERKVRKIYYAIVLGKLPNKVGTIKKRLIRIKKAANENKVQIDNKGKIAITNYKVLREHKLNTPSGDKIISEVEVEILTGRTHQVRVHLASLGTPIIGDNKYGDKKFNSYISKNFFLNRQALHSWKIEFFHYGKGKVQVLEARIKKDLIDFIKRLEAKASFTS